MIELDAPRNEKGWYLFNPDASYRKQFFPDEAMQHPAKANLFMIEAVIKAVSKKGEMLLDPMSGTGSIMMGAPMGRRVVCIEIEDYFYGIIEKGRAMLHNAFGCGDLITTLHGDCRQFLPLVANHVIFSPPYASIMKKKGFTAGDISDDLYGKAAEGLLQYSKSPMNIGNQPKFFYNMEMEKIYKKLLDTLVPGGTMTVIIKDYIQDGKRVYLSEWVVRSCIRMGFEVDSWWKWKAPGSAFLNIRRSRGEPVVEDEDLICLRKNVV